MSYIIIERFVGDLDYLNKLFGESLRGIKIDLFEPPKIYDISDEVDHIMLSAYIVSADGIKEALIRNGKEDVAKNFGEIFKEGALFSFRNKACFKYVP